jgi:hypothetical protein
MSLKSDALRVVICQYSEGDRNTGGGLEEPAVSTAHRPPPPKIGVPVAGVGVWKFRVPRSDHAT